MSLTDASQAAVGAALTVLILTIALVAPLVYVAFYATNFTFFQKVVVVLVSLILAAAPGGANWIFWAGGQGSFAPLCPTHECTQERATARVVSSTPQPTAS